MNERARRWNALMDSKDIKRGSKWELAFIKREFAGVRRMTTFRPYLSNGFPSKHDNALRRLFGDEYDRELWLRPAGLEVLDRSRTALWLGEPIKDMDGFCASLANVYREADTYSYLRVAGASSGNRTPVGELDEQGLLMTPKRAGVRMIYLTPIWERIRSGRLCGTSVHVVKSIDRLVELWAAVELLRQYDSLEKNAVYLIQFDDRGRPKIDPTIGIRTVDGDRILLSLLPTDGEDTPPYSDWIVSSRLSEFGEQAVARARMPPARKLSSLMPRPLEEAMEEAFEAMMVGGIDCDRNYGPLDRFEKVRTLKDRMVEWPEDLWLPPIG